MIDPEAKEKDSSRADTVYISPPWQDRAVGCVLYICEICGKEFKRTLESAAVDAQMGIKRTGLCSYACSFAKGHPEPVDMVNSPPHYKDRVPGIEAIDVTQHFNFCLGNAIKYIWRADMKGGDEDLEKAIWYLQRELNERRKRR